MTKPFEEYTPYEKLVRAIVMIEGLCMLADDEYGITPDGRLLSDIYQIAHSARNICGPHSGFLENVNKLQNDEDFNKNICNLEKHTQEYLLKYPEPIEFTVGPRGD